MKPVLIPLSHLPVCKMGQGEKCCRYLMFGYQFSCAKHTELKPVIDARVMKMTAQGDNCPGLS